MAAAADFETPPDETPAASLPADEVGGSDYHVLDPVHGDGLMRHYVVDSRFGSYTAYGRRALDLTLQEIKALSRIAKTSDVEVVMASAERGVETDIKTAAGVALHPVRTIVGIPRGIAHLFKGYSAQAKEIASKIKNAGQPAAGHQGGSGAKIASDASRYADQYLGISAAERRWYQHFGVDPYTNNSVLRRAVARLAKIDATTSLGMKFATLPAIPFVGQMRRVMDAIYNEDPAVLRARRRDTLLGYGLSPAEIDRFDNTLLLSPTQQHRIEEAANQLTGVEGRSELFRHAMSVTSDYEVGVFVNSLEMLAAAHHRNPVARIVSGLRLPTAQLVDQRVLVFGAFDQIYWTQDVGAYEQALHLALPADTKGLELWTSGKVSERARAELNKRGWDVHESG
jgi:hypothetical protein